MWRKPVIASQVGTVNYYLKWHYVLVTSLASFFNLMVQLYDRIRLQVIK